MVSVLSRLLGGEIIVDLDIASIEDDTHGAIDAEMIHQQSLSATFIEVCTGLSEQRVHGELQV